MSGVAAGAIPTILLEEHHEALLVWSYARQKGWIAPRGNTLLHVDSHDDMMAPLLREPLPASAGPEQMIDFVYREMDVATFIWPAVYLQWVNRVVFLHHSHPAASIGWRRLAIRSRNDADREFVVSAAPRDRLARAPAGTSYLDYARIIPSMSIDRDQQIILDIDLDYFLANNFPEPVAPEIEITEHVYTSFQSEPYHFLRLIPRIKVSAVERGGRYYLRFFDYSLERAASEDEESLIVQRMSRLVGFLEDNQVRPSIICLCRSHFSGYTPARWLEPIQSLLLSRLGGVYSMELTPIASLLEGMRRESATAPLGGMVASCSA